MNIEKEKLVFYISPHAKRILLEKSKERRIETSDLRRAINTSKSFNYGGENARA